MHFGRQGHGDGVKMGHPANGGHTSLVPRELGREDSVFVQFYLFKPHLAQFGFKQSGKLTLAFAAGHNTGAAVAFGGDGNVAQEAFGEFLGEFHIIASAYFTGG